MATAIACQRVYCQLYIYICCHSCPSINAIGPAPLRSVSCVLVLVDEMNLPLQGVRLMALMLGHQW
jgi:hypothetical protein